MVPIWSERLPCSSHSADQKIDHLQQRPAEADAGYAETGYAAEADVVWQRPTPPFSPHIG
jgi:hypothetical protein